MEKWMKNSGYLFLTCLALFTVFCFVISIFFLTVQTYNNSGTDSGTILSGFISGGLSMIGGIIGAGGAYYVARHQMKAQNRILDQEKKFKSRPMITCTELNNVYGDLSNIHYDRSAILLNAPEDKKEKGHLFVIHFIGQFNVVLNVTLELFISGKSESFIKNSIGGLKQENETLLFRPVYRHKSGVSTNIPVNVDKIVITYTTEEGENLKFVMDNNDKVERYYLIKNNGKNEWLNTFHFESGNWKVPGRYKEPLIVNDELENNIT